MDYCCEIVENSEEGQTIAAIIRYDNGKLTSEATRGYENVLSSVMQQSMLNREEGVEISAADDPEEWIQLLPENIYGTYLFARLVV